MALQTCIFLHIHAWPLLFNYALIKSHGTPPKNIQNILEKFQKYAERFNYPSSIFGTYLVKSCYNKRGPYKAKLF